MDRRHVAMLLAAVTSACSPADEEPSPTCVAEGYQPHVPLALPGEGDKGDPHVIVVDGTWYLYPSGAAGREDGFHVWTSEDLKTWTEPEQVWWPQPGTWHDGGEEGRTRDCTYWAPSVHPGDGGYYLYYTANCRIGVAFSDSPTGPFEELLDHPVIGSGYGGIGNGQLGDSPQDFDELAIDPFLWDDPDHGMWLLFVAYNPLSSIYAVPMADHTTPSGEPVLLLEPDGGSWEGLVVEGVWLQPSGGALHLMYSGNFVHKAGYAIGSARGASPDGPFERNPNNPILATDDVPGVFAPGHHSVAPGPDGSPVIFYHDTYDPAPRREVRAGPLCEDESGNLRVGR